MEKVQDSDPADYSSCFWSCGDLREHLKFDSLFDSLELEVSAVGCGFMHRKRSPLLHSSYFRCNNVGFCILIIINVPQITIVICTVVFSIFA